MQHIQQYSLVWMRYNLLNPKFHFETDSCGMVSVLTMDVYPAQTADKTQQLIRSTIRQWQIALCNKMKKFSLLESIQVILANTNMLNLKSGIHHFPEK